MSRYGHLAERNRQVVKMAAKMPVREIAKVMDMTDSAVRHLLVREGRKAAPAITVGDPIAYDGEASEREARIISNGKMAAALLREKAATQSSQSGA